MKLLNLLKLLNFEPKNNTTNIYYKKYSHLNSYIIEINLEKNTIDFGNQINFNDTNKSTQKNTKGEDLVVLECIDRLLTKGYSPKNIILEKVYPSGHGTSGRLDILVTTQDAKAYMMIECKTWGKEFEKALAKLNKDGGQLFTYFQQDKDADVLVLYTSKFENDTIEYQNQIVKIEDEYRSTSNVKDLFDRWNKIPKNNGVFDSWTDTYEFVSKALTKKDLKALKQEDSSFIFNRFLEILRHNVVSDKPNAFNKIFTLFLCKIIDEDRSEDEELHFQWLDGKDTDISFQKRLTDLYNRGMKELLEKKVTDISDSEFENQFQQVEDTYKEKFKEILTEIRLKKNNEFAIKEVYDDESFNENAIVVKEIVELLQGYQIRYNYRQQFLSDFFELLLTTGLKQESGQFFTPVPVARFIIRSIPFDKIIQDKINKGERNDLLPTIIDYSAGSGHFITESMEEIQNCIDRLDEESYSGSTKKAISRWKVDQFDWAEDFVYAIERDYRLVKTAKVSCYLHGDGLAKVIHGDGLDDFSTSKTYKDRLLEVDATYKEDNKQFDIVVSNPPYSVSAFKTMMDDEKSKRNFELFSRLTDQSSEIEALFIERTKQLLKDGGVAGIILPSSILTGGGIYIRTREIIFKYFDIVSITELGSNTFMATGTNTVVLFLRRKNNMEHQNIKTSVDKLFNLKQDITINGIENPLSKYLSYVWEDISINEYISLLEHAPNVKITGHNIYKEYTHKYKEFEEIIELEKEKFFYFVLSYNQKVTIVKTGEKKDEKNFLGYEFSTRRGSEGIHPIQRGKSIDECTSLYDDSSYENQLKANSYIYSSFLGKKEAINETLKKNISYIDLVDMMSFDRTIFEKNISLNAKKKVKYNDIWKSTNIVELKDISTIEKGKSITKEKVVNGDIPVVAGGQNPAYYHNQANREAVIVTVSASGAYAGFVNFFDIPIFASDCNTVKSNNEEKISTKLIFIFLKHIQSYIYELQKGQAQPHVYGSDLEKIKIPLPPKDIQDQIVKEIEKLENIEKQSYEIIESLKLTISEIINNLNGSKKQLLTDISVNWDYKRKPVTASDRVSGKYPYYGASGIVDYVNGYLLDDTVLLISEDGANLKSRVTPIAFSANGKIWVNNHAHILKFENEYTHKIVELYFNHMDLSPYITGQAQPKLNQKNLNNIEIPLPSLEEQKKIVKEIENIEEKINDLQAKLDNIPQQKEKILNKYLK